MNTQLMASVSPIVRDPDAARALYADALGVTFEGGEGDYVFTAQLPGAKHFGLWPLADAASACFGEVEWPADVPVPQVSMEFEVGGVDEVAGAAAELEGRGYRLLHGAKTEPWGQEIARLLSADGVLVGVCYTPWYHDH
jgi:catechol 2,3-dioxygenase-like lactoylglutathione lyase family enzyme